MSGLILYTTDDGKTRLHLHTLNGQLWLSQAEIAELFQTTVSNINKHIKDILASNEQDEATIEYYSIVQNEGKRQVTRKVAHYNLRMILSVGYRVRSPRGLQFRQWATEHLNEYLVKGFVMDDQRLKEPDWDYFDELLERIREIRASEKRFYQKVRDLFALSDDYQASNKEAQFFFAEAQNKLLYGVTQKTAAEIIAERASPDAANMALTNWAGTRVRKRDVVIAKNYLSKDEVDTLNRLVVIFLEQAELRVKERKTLTLAYWQSNIDRLLAFNDKPILEGAGLISMKAAQDIAHRHYTSFDEPRRLAEAKKTDSEDLQEIEALEKKLTSQKGGEGENA